MSAIPPLSFDLAKLPEIQRRLPASDFVAPQYDEERSVRTTDVLVLLSTPRSGSTLLCELLRVNDVCVMHEYFQPGQYMPVLAERWNCLSGGRLDEEAYVKSLRRFRTHASGWLGINLHGSHLRYFMRMERHLQQVNLHYVHLVRRDLLSQAVSYHVASRTIQWSSEFKTDAAPEYDYLRIRKRMQRILDQTALIQAFLLARRAAALTIYYEDLVARTGETLRRLPCMPPDGALRLNPTLRRQSNERSAAWTEQFARELLARETESQVRPPVTFLARLKRALRRSPEHREDRV